MRRIARILPAYVVALVGLSLLSGSRAALDHPVTFLFLPSGYDDVTVREVVAPAWTLHLEADFYLALPVLAAIVRLGGPRRSFLNTAWLLVVVGFGGLLLEPLLAANGFTFLIVGLVCGFLPGMLVAATEARFPAAFARLADPRVALAGVAAIVVACLVEAQAIEMGAAIGAAPVLPWASRLQLPGARAWSFAPALPTPSTSGTSTC